MVVGDEARRALRELGLTGYESSIYLSLVEGGVLTASDASETAGVPFSKVYEVLNNLERKGWINIEHGRPSRYFPKAPIEAFEAAKRELDEKMQKWENAVSQDLQPLYEKRELREKPEIWILRGETNVVTKLREMMRKARSQVMIAVPSFALNLAEKAIPLLTDLGLDKVKVQIMVAGDSGLWRVDELNGVIEMRRRDNLFGGGVIVDREEALLILGEDRPSLVVWSNHVGLVTFAKDYFQYLWHSSAKA